MTTPPAVPNEPITVRQNPPLYEAMQWLNQGDPNDPAVFPPALAMSAGSPIWVVAEDGTLMDGSNSGFGSYPVGQWFISGAYYGPFPGWQQTAAYALPDNQIIGDATATYSQVTI